MVSLESHTAQLEQSLPPPASRCLRRSCRGAHCCGCSASPRGDLWRGHSLLEQAGRPATVPRLQHPRGRASGPSLTSDLDCYLMPSPEHVPVHLIRKVGCTHRQQRPGHLQGRFPNSMKATPPAGPESRTAKSSYLPHQNLTPQPGWCLSPLGANGSPGLLLCLPAVTKGGSSRTGCFFLLLLAALLKGAPLWQSN